MSAHTKGPWSVGKTSVGIPAVFSDTSPRAIAMLGLRQGDEFYQLENHEANARLIAAAPELLEALEMLASYPVAWEYPDGPCIKAEDMTEIRAAIAKAKGEQP